MPLDGTADLEVDGETLHDALRRVNADISNLPQLTCFFQGKIPFIPVITGQTFYILFQK